MDTTVQLWDLRKYCLSHGMSGVHYSCCPPAGQTSLLGYLTRVASVIDGQCRDMELDIGICCGGFLAQCKEYPGLYFERDAQQMSRNLDNDRTHLLIRQGRTQNSWTEMSTRDLLMISGEH